MMDINQGIEKFKKIEEEIIGYNHAISLLYYDALTSSTLGSARNRSKTMGQLTGKRHELMSGNETFKLIDFLLEYKEILPPILTQKLLFFKNHYGFERSIPADEFRCYMETVHLAESFWKEAKRDSNLEVMLPYYEKIINFQKKFAHYYSPEKDAYDVLLERYEPGFQKRQLDELCEKVKNSFVPLISKIRKKTKEPVINLPQIVGIDKQAKISYLLMECMGLTKEFCLLGETEHPFTIRMNQNDIRITTHYYEENFFDSIFTVLHEGGHALYEHNMDIAFGASCLCEGASMGIHESQSRFLENHIGRNKYFWDFLYPKINELLDGQLSHVSSESIYKYINRCQPTLIRIEADELTYPLHIIVRYEIEKMLFSGELSVDKVSEVWNQKYKEYLGVDVPDDRHGVLQDSHWSGGSFAYFPSYLIGSAYAAQFMNFMEKELNLNECLRSGELHSMIEWLNDRVHRIGPTMTPNQIIKSACGRDFSCDYYINYIINKYSEIYSL